MSPWQKLKSSTLWVSTHCHQGFATWACRPMCTGLQYSRTVAQCSANDRRRSDWQNADAWPAHMDLGSSSALPFDFSGPEGSRKTIADQATEFGSLLPGSSEAQALECRRSMRNLSLPDQTGGQHTTHTSPSTRSEAALRPARILHAPHLRSCRSPGYGGRPSTVIDGRQLHGDLILRSTRAAADIDSDSPPIIYLHRVDRSTVPRLCVARATDPSANPESTCRRLGLAQASPRSRRRSAAATSLR